MLLSGPTELSNAVRVLLLEDERVSAEIISEYLRNMRGLAVRLDHAGTLAEARAWLASGVPYDLLIVDLHVPDSKGLGTLEAIANGSNALVIVTTADSNPDLRDAVLARGAYDFVHKSQLGRESFARLVRLAAVQADTVRSLRRSQARLRAVVDTEPECVKLLDRAGRLLEMNPAGLRMIEAESLESVRGQCVFPLVVAGQRAAFQALVERVAGGGEGTLEFEAVGLKGTRSWLHTRMVPLRDESSGERLVLGITRDITAQKQAEDAMRESEARFRSLVELSSDFYWETDPEHRLVHSTHDRKYEPLSNPLTGKRRWDVPSIEPDEAGWKAHRADLAARRPFHDFILGRVDPRGVRRYLAISGEPVFGPQGEFLGYRGVGRDISERRREERLVALEHAVTRALADTGSVGDTLRRVMGAICESEAWDAGRYFQVDAAASRLCFSQAWCRPGSAMEKFAERSRGLTFARGEGLIGRVWETGEPLWIEDVSGDARVAQQALAREMGVHGGFVFPVVFGDAVAGVMAFSHATVREPDARLMQTLRAIASQIGQFLQRKSAEAALGESETRFRETFELAATGIAHVSLEGRFLRVNRRLCEMLGYAEAELVGRSVKEVSHPDDRDLTDAERERMRAGEIAAARFEKRYFRKDGSLAWLALTVALARDAQGAPQHEISVLEDITGRKEREGTLQRFRAALDSSADMVFLFRMRDGALLDFNHTVASALGYSREELLTMQPTDFRSGITDEGLRAELVELLAAPCRSNIVATEYRRKDGSTFPAESRRSILDTPQGRVVVVNSRDLSERRSAEKRRARHARYQRKIARLGQSALARRDSAELLEQAVQTVLEGLSGGAVAYVERDAAPDEVVLKRVAGVAEPVAEAEAARCAPGSPLALVLDTAEAALAAAPWGEGAPLPFAWAQRYAAAAIVPVPGDRGARGALVALAEKPEALGPEESRFLGAAASMVSAALHRLDSEARLAYLAQFDPLTGLPNRALLADRFSQMVVLARRRAALLGVLFIDLDDFKLVNDTQGHAAGDDLLKETAQRLLAAVRQGDTVARISGDEFAVILGDLARADDAALVAQKIIDRLGEGFAIRGQEMFVTASIGIATFPADGDNAEALLGAADAAMYRAKQAGRNAFQFFTAEINQRTRARAHLGVELRRALERDEYTLAYQPKIDLATGRAIGAEALLRWNHPERGTVMPAEFIPVLEESGLIVPVGEWVLERACRDLKAWQAAGRKVMPVAVNLSARQFRQQDLDERIRAIVDAAGIEPSLIELEITESQLMHDPEHATRVLRALGKAGLRVAIDDFGTGYSSLAYLTRFPLASLKIDRSFVSHALSDRADATIVRSIVEMAHTLGFTVVAEGVESGPQADFLRSLGCEQAQGYLFARPMPAAEFLALISAPQPAKARPRLREAVRKRKRR